MNPDEVYRLALELYGDPVEAKIAAAQMQLETGGGRAMPGNNLFGIKGPGQSLRTMESVDGAMTPTTASFRTYSDPRASIIDRLRFLEDNPRYAEAGYFQAVTPEQKADALQRAGYATDPNYATKLKSILSGGGPMIYDASDFPQFDPAGMGLVPVSAQPPGPAGLLGMTPVQPLLGPAQPQGLLDRFAPGSGYGYDVALGIAQTQGGPMTALAGGFANAKERAFERQMAGANLQTQTGQLMLQQQQAQFARQKAEEERLFRQQKMEMEQRKLGMPKTGVVDGQVYSIDPNTGEITFTRPTGTATTEFPMDEDIRREVAAGRLTTKEGIDLQTRLNEQRKDRQEAFYKDFKKETEKYTESLAQWEAVRTITPDDIKSEESKILDSELVKRFSKMILPGEAVMSDDVRGIMEASQNWIQSNYAKYIAGAKLSPTERAEIIRRMGLFAQDAAAALAQKRTEWEKRLERYPNLDTESIFFGARQEYQPYPYDLPEPKSGTKLDERFTVDNSQ